MKTFILSAVFLLSISFMPLSVASDETLHSTPVVHTIYSSPHTFTVQTHLTVTPTNWEKWEIFDLGGLELVSYNFEQSNLVGSVGTQIWTFKAPQAGEYFVTFSRDNKTKVVPITASTNILWCGTGIEFIKPIEF